MFFAKKVDKIKVAFFDKAMGTMIALLEQHFKADFASEEFETAVKDAPIEKLKEIEPILTFFLNVLKNSKRDLTSELRDAGDPAWYVLTLPCLISQVMWNKEDEANLKEAADE